MIGALRRRAEVKPPTLNKQSLGAVSPSKVKGWSDEVIDRVGLHKPQLAESRHTQQWLLSKLPGV